MQGEQLLLLLWGFFLLSQDSYQVIFVSAFERGQAQHIVDPITNTLTVRHLRKLIKAVNKELLGFQISASNPVS